MSRPAQRSVILLSGVDKRRLQAQTYSIRPVPAVVKSCREREVNQQSPEPIVSYGEALLWQLAERPGGRRDRAGKSTVGAPSEIGLPRVLALCHPAFGPSSGACRVSHAVPRWSFKIGSFPDAFQKRYGNSGPAVVFQLPSTGSKRTLMDVDLSATAGMLPHSLYYNPTSRAYT